MINNSVILQYGSYSSNVDGGTLVNLPISFISYYVITITHSWTSNSLTCTNEGAAKAGGSFTDITLSSFVSHKQVSQIKSCWLTIGY